MGVSYMRDMEQLVETTPGLRVESKRRVPHTTFTVYRLTRLDNDTDSTQPPPSKQPTSPASPSRVVTQV